MMCTVPFIPLVVSTARGSLAPGSDPPCLPALPSVSQRGGGCLRLCQSLAASGCSAGQLEGAENGGDNGGG